LRPIILEEEEEEEEEISRAAKDLEGVLLMKLP